MCSSSDNNSYLSGGESVISKFIHDYKQSLKSEKIDINFDVNDETDSVNVSVIVFEPQKLPDLDVDKKQLANDMVKDIGACFVDKSLIANLKLSFVFEEGALCDSYATYDYKYTNTDF